jgi:hypothetical protein
MQQAFKRLALKPGDIFESCSYHPILCLGVDYRLDHIWGVSLIDGSHPRSCSLLHCGVRKLSPRQAWKIKMNGPLDLEAREEFREEARWWSVNTESNESRVGLVGPRKTAAPAKARKTLASKSVRSAK